MSRQSMDMIAWRVASGSPESDMKEVLLVHWTIQLLNKTVSLTWPVKPDNVTYLVLFQDTMGQAGLMNEFRLLISLSCLDTTIALHPAIVLLPDVQCRHRIIVCCCPPIQTCQNLKVISILFLSCIFSDTYR
jgi:hypothetical protein